jgi:hypothetical protein
VTGHSHGDRRAGGHLPGFRRLEQARHRGGRSGFDEDSFLTGEELVRSKDLIVGDRVDESARVVAGGDRLRPAGGIADADRGCDRVRLIDRVAEHERCGTGSLEAPHLGQPFRHTQLPVLVVALPVRRDVAGVADGQHMDVGSIAEDIDDLEGRGLLALDAIGVDRVDEVDRVGLGEFAAQRQAVVEVPVDLEQGRTVRDGLAHLPGRDLA